MNTYNKLNSDSLYIDDIKQIVWSARHKAYSVINTAMVEAYWLIGKRIVEEEQNGAIRAEYGKKVLEKVSVTLTTDFGKGFSLRNVRNFRKFYLIFPDLPSFRQTLSAELSWSHYLLIMGVSNKDAQTYYLKETAQNMWSVRTLERNISTL